MENNFITNMDIQMFTHNEKSTTMDIENLTQNEKSAIDTTVLTMIVKNFTKDEASTDDNTVVNFSFIVIFALLVFGGVLGNSVTVNLKNATPLTQRKYEK